MRRDQAIRFNASLAPLSALYGIGVWIRNRLFDGGILPSKRYEIPVIGVGNLAVGGTGKTPHAEYLIRLLRDRYRVAVLSRGYKRTTTGFLLARADSTCQEIGDESYQMKRKFPDIQVAVDANRCRGIRRLLDLPVGERPEVILLDDAFQHRYVSPSLNILLTGCHRLYIRDKLLPMGHLRESAEGAKRADAIIITKCEPDIRPIDDQRVRARFRLSADQRLFFSHIRYGELTAVFPEEAPRRSLRAIQPDEAILLVSGIANPTLLEREIRIYTGRVSSLAFPDHHAFNERDIRRIQTAFDRLASPGRLLIVTEKDAARLRDHPAIPAEWHTHLYYLPISVGFCGDQEKSFQEYILKHIKTYRSL